MLHDVAQKEIAPVIAEETGEECEFFTKREQYLPVANLSDLHVHYTEVFFSVVTEASPTPLNFRMDIHGFISWLNATHDTMQAAAEFYSGGAMLDLIERLFGTKGVSLADILSLADDSQQDENTPLQASAVLGTNPETEENTSEENTEEEGEDEDEWEDDYPYDEEDDEDEEDNSDEEEIPEVVEGEWEPGM